MVGSELRSYVKVEVNVLGSPVPTALYGLCGRKATLKKKSRNGVGVLPKHFRGRRLLNRCAEPRSAFFKSNKSSVFISIKSIRMKEKIIKIIINL